MKLPLMAFCMVVGISIFADMPATAPTTFPTTQAIVRGFTWHDSFDSAFAAAQSRNSLLIVVLCERSSDPLAAAIERTLQENKELTTTVLARLSPQDRDNLRALGVAKLPAVRVVNANGTIVARHDGRASIDQIQSLLADGGKSQATKTDERSIDAWLAALASSDASAREAAARALSAKAKDSAEKVIALLSSNDLTARVSATDLLATWGAPLESVDPWKPESITPQLISALREWTKTLPSVPATQSASTIDTAASELDQLVSAVTIPEAQAVRERLARYGELLLPEVYRRLTEAASEQARMRLGALRYRLVATDALAAAFPGGFDRLVSADLGTRRSAMNDLLQKISASDTRLLIELFSSDDPYIRERALRALRSLGGEQTTAALLKLLEDPEPNVRASVLKTLAEEKIQNATICSELAKYIATETNADLVVHAVRAFRMMQSEESCAQLISLSAHANWQVRGEAIEAMRESLNNVSAELKMKACVALIKRLEDDEGYVVGQAVQALAQQDLASAVDPMLKAAGKHPQMAPEILRIISKNRSLRTTAVPKIIEMLKGDSPELRAGALLALCEMSPQSASKHLVEAWSSDNTALRTAAAKGTIIALQALRPGSDDSDYRAVQAAAKLDLNEWLRNFRSSPPAWLDQLKPQLVKEASKEGEIGVLAAVALAAVGDNDRAMPVLTAAASRNQHILSVSVALRWLDWPQREALFKVIAGNGNSAVLPGAVSVFAEISDLRTIELIWNLLQNSAHPNAALQEQACESLRFQYLGSDYYNASALPADKREKAINELVARAKSKDESQRLTALSILSYADAPKTAEIATDIYKDSSVSRLVRRAALQAALGCGPDENATALAIEAIQSPDTADISLRFLAMGAEALYRLNDGIEVQVSRTSSVTYGEGTVITIKPPAGLKREWLEPFLKSDDELATCASYVLTVLGDRNAFGPLEKAWRAAGMGDSDLTPLVYRAIAASNDDSRVPILQEIYRAWKDDQWRLREFYWTIRSMKGDAILKLRKQIRDEIGMDRLR